MTEQELSEKIKDLGGKLYLVGGAVRDSVMGIAPKDKDYVITGVDVNDLPFNNMVGKDFPVFLVNIDGESCEVALARKERNTGRKHTDFECIYDSSITIKEDLHRRDLTINAMAWDIEYQKLIDPFDGMSDIRDKILRAVSTSFMEDPLRVYRLARFTCMDDFRIDFGTSQMCSSMKEELVHLPGERVAAEMIKALALPDFSNFFRSLRIMGLLQVHFPEVHWLDVPDMHDGTAFEHTMIILDCVPNTGILFKFGILCHDLGKGRTDPSKHPHHHGHDALGVDAVNDLCDRLKLPNNFREVGTLSSKTHMKMKRTKIMRKGKLFKFIEENKKWWHLLVSISGSDSLFRGCVTVDEEKEIAKLINFNSAIEVIYEETIKKVTGKMLMEEGFEPGPKFGETLLQRRIHYFMRKIKEEGIG